MEKFVENHFLPIGFGEAGAFEEAREREDTNQIGSFYQISRGKEIKYKEKKFGVAFDGVHGMDPLGNFAGLFRLHKIYKSNKFIIKFIVVFFEVFDPVGLQEQGPAVFLAGAAFVGSAILYGV